MNINELYYAIQAVNSDSTLDEERRTIRLTIYQALLHYVNGMNKLNGLMNDILVSGKKLEKISDYYFFVNEDLEKTRILVKGYILESRLIKVLHENGINKYSFSDIDRYLKKCILDTGDTMDDVSLAVEMYPKLLSYKQEYLNVFSSVSKYLSEIFGDEMLKNSGDVKSKYERILKRIDRMMGRSLFDERTKEWLEELLYSIFSFYVNNTISIPLDTQIDVSGTKELIA